MAFELREHNEWLETDGLGGFATGTATGIRTRRYHGLLLTATTPPTGRFMLVNGLEVTAKTSRGRFRLTPQRYTPDYETPAEGVELESFTHVPCPTWVYRLSDGTRIEHRVAVTKCDSLHFAGVAESRPRTIVSWRLLSGAGNVTLYVRPLISGRDYHELHHENAAFCFDADTDDHRVRWQPYAGVPSISATHSGVYRHDPVWYRNFQYNEERARGFECREDLASPGEFVFDISAIEGVLMLTAEPATGPASLQPTPTVHTACEYRDAELARRARFASGLERAGDDYIVQRGTGSTIVAGYPWFADWGRDTFLSIRGLCLSTGRLEDARAMLLEWSTKVCVGMLPNRFPDRGEEAEYNSVDAALWFVIAAHELLLESERIGTPLTASDALALTTACDAILSGYESGTGYGIGMDTDGLLRAGVPGVQLTWMDARVGTWVVTPRHGKPVEVQALWLNALHLASRATPRWASLFERGVRSFRDKFWNPSTNCLFDVIDSPCEPRNDPSIRPNQILAVGGLPVQLLPASQARAVVSVVERQLLTPIGLRSLAPDSSGYRPRYEGDSGARDSAYHQGTVWPWLLGPFVEAWVRVEGDAAATRSIARERFLGPILRHLNTAGLGHVSEIADAEPPHTPRGCPFQAWSLAELIRLDRVVLASRVRGAGEAGGVPVVKRDARPATRTSTSRR